MVRSFLVLLGVAGYLLVLQAVTAAQGAGPQERPTADAIAALRSRGQDGLQEALRKYDALLQQQEQLSLSCSAVSGEQVAKLKNELDSWCAAIDQISGQRGCTVSRLYWYTDLEAAKAAAKREGKPILSLRMLGKLTDEYSCANSRFFRTALYSNQEISEFLRTNYILHWQSVRPVPRVTIDFGDGRKLERTITGNSAHYVLASDGTPLDVLPGLYSPVAFRQWLGDLRSFQLQFDKVSAADRPAKLQQFHAQSGDELLRRWDLDIQALGEQQAELVRTRIGGALVGARVVGQEVPPEPAPKAVKAATRAVGKTAVEAPVLRFAQLGGAWMERGMDDELWQAVANLHRGDMKLDEASIAVMRREVPAEVAMRLSASKARQEDPVLRLVRSFENSIGLDTVRNEYLLHRRVHEQFVEGTSLNADVDALNEWVYAELFLTPSSDPWLGLSPRDVYTALPNDGRTDAAKNVAGGG